MGPRLLLRLLVLLVALIGAVYAFAPAPSSALRRQHRRRRPLLPVCRGRPRLQQQLLRQSAQRDDEQEQQQLMVVADGSSVGVLVRSHAALMQALCPAVSSCRVYLPTDLLLLDSEEGAEGEEEDDWRLGEAALGRYLAASEPVDGQGRDAALLACPDKDSQALLAPLGPDGWIAVEMARRAGAAEEDGGWSRLRPSVECLRTALVVVGRERASGVRTGARLRGLMRELRQPLGALRTFGKLLLRRLEKTDAEGLNQELTANVLVSSDALVEVLHRHEGAPAATATAEGAAAEAEPPSSAEALEPSTRQRASPAAGSSSVRGPSSSSSSDPRAFLAPIVAAAQAISRRDGVRFQSHVEEGLPRLRIDERGFQEALGTMIELALASSLAAATAAATPAGAGQEQEQEQGAAAAPAVSLEVRSHAAAAGAGGDGGGRGRSGVQFIVRDNGFWDTTTVVRGGRELGRAREAIERMGARLEIRRSESLGGTHMAVLFEGEAG